METLIELVDDERLNPAALDESDPAQSMMIARINSAIEDASDMIDSYASAHNTVPFVNPPKVIKQLAVSLAVYSLYTRTAVEVPEARTTAQKNAIRFLESIRDGKMQIGTETVTTSGTPETNLSETSRQFTADTLGGF